MIPLKQLFQKYQHQIISGLSITEKNHYSCARVKFMSIYSIYNHMWVTMQNKHKPSQTSQLMFQRYSKNQQASYVRNLQLLTCKRVILPLKRQTGEWTKVVVKGDKWRGRVNTVSRENLPVGNCIRGWGWALEGEGTSVEETGEAAEREFSQHGSPEEKDQCKWSISSLLQRRYLKLNANNILFII